MFGRYGKDRGLRIWLISHNGRAVEAYRRGDTYSLISGNAGPVVFVNAKDRPYRHYGEWELIPDAVLDWMLDMDRERRVSAIPRSSLTAAIGKIFSRLRKGH